MSPRYFGLAAGGTFGIRYGSAEGRAGQGGLHLGEQDRVAGLVGAASVVFGRADIVALDGAGQIGGGRAVRLADSGVAALEQLAELRDRLRIVDVDRGAGALQLGVER